MRRLKQDLIYCYKIIHGLTCLLVDDFFVLSNVNNTRGHSFKLTVPVSRINCRLNFFSVRVVNIWNKLPDHVVSARTAVSFSKSLQNVNLSTFLRGKA